MPGNYAQEQQQSFVPGYSELRYTSQFRSYAVCQFGQSVLGGLPVKNGNCRVLSDVALDFAGDMDETKKIKKTEKRKS